MAQPRSNEKRYALQQFIKRNRICNYRHLMHARNVASENLIRDIFANMIEASALSLKRWPAQPKQPAIAKAKYVKTSKERNTMHLAKV